MSKKNIKSKKYSPYRRYSFNRNLARSWNDESYHTWLIMDEGQERPDPQRLTNFIFKYGIKNKKIGKSILSYIPQDHKKLMLQWIRMTKSERKNVRKYAPDAGRKITHWLHQAEIMYLDELNNI